MREELSGVAYSGVGYVSHSFAQFMTSSDDEIFSVDLGDAYPRAIILFRGNGASGNVEKANLFEIPGNIGQNITGIHLGGIEYTSVTTSSAIEITSSSNMQNKELGLITENNVIITGRMESNYDEDWDANTQYKNVFISVANLLDDGSIGVNDIIMITDYSREDAIMTTTPKLVKITDEKLYLIWNEYTTNLTEDGVVRYTQIDNNGNMITDIMTTEGAISDVQPIVNNEIIHWYTTTGDVPTFYELDTTTNIITTTDAIGESFEYEPIIVEYEEENSAEDETEIDNEQSYDDDDDDDDWLDSDNVDVELVDNNY